MKFPKSKTALFFALVLTILIGNLQLLSMIRPAQAQVTDSYVPIKWAVVILGGYNYYRNLDMNSIQRIERIIQGRGVPYDMFRDDDLVAPTDTPPAGKYALQYANGTLKYQALVLLFDWDYSDTSGVNQNYIYWAVGNGTNAVLFNKVARAVPSLLGLTASDVGFVGGAGAGAAPTHRVLKTFNDGIREYAQNTVVTMGTSLYYHAIIRNSAGKTVWFNKTWSSYWSLGMANTTYYHGSVWYLGFSLNEPAMESASSRYVVSWNDWRINFWGHAINFALNNVERISVEIMPYKRWKGAWIIRIDLDSIRWRTSFLPPESVLQAGWVFDEQYNVLGAGRTVGYTNDLALTNGAPSGYTGIPSSRVMNTEVTGVLQTDLTTGRNYRAIIYNSTNGGNFDRIRLDFNGNRNFADDTAYGIWQNMTYPTVQGKLYWCALIPNSATPQSINVAWWQTPMLMDSEATNLPLFKRYGAEYGMSYSFHSWQHVRINGGSSYAMWSGTQFILNSTYVEEKLNASRYWMMDKFGDTGNGFDSNEVVMSHSFNEHPAEVDAAINRLPWILFQYSEPLSYVGFGKTSATSKYMLCSSNDEYFYQYARFAVYEDMVKTLYPVISTYTHRLNYNTSFTFPPYTDSIKPANPRDAYHFWLDSKSMLTNMAKAYYGSDKIVLEFTANSGLKDFVWKFPVQLGGKEFSGFSDNRSIGQIKHTDANYVYVEFSQGQGPQRVEVTYGTPVPDVYVTVSSVSPPNSGTTSPTAGTYAIDENTLFSISATPLPGYTFDHWELDSVNVGSTNPYSFNVGTTNHAIAAFFEPIPTVDVTVLEPSPPNSGTTNPSPSTYSLTENTVFSISATPLSGYVFDHWELDGNNMGSTSPYSFNVGISNHAIGAFFQALPPVTVTVSPVSPPDTGSTNPVAGEYQVPQNSLFQISATASTGYIFDHWELDGTQVSTQTSYSFNVGSSSHTLSAFFRERPVQETVQVDSCDSLTNWSSEYATLSLDNSDRQEGTSSIQLSPTAPFRWHIYTTLRKSMNFASYSRLQMWIKVTDSTKSLRVAVHTDWSNYNVYTFTGLVSNTWVLASIDLSTPTSRTGTVNLASIAFIRFDYYNQATSVSFKVDDIQGVLA